MIKKQVAMKMCGPTLIKLNMLYQKLSEAARKPHFKVAVISFINREYPYEKITDS